MSSARSAAERAAAAACVAFAIGAAAVACDAEPPPPVRFDATGVWTCTFPPLDGGLPDAGPEGPLVSRVRIDAWRAPTVGDCLGCSLSMMPCGAPLLTRCIDADAIVLAGDFRAVLDGAFAGSVGRVPDEPLCVRVVAGDGMLPCEGAVRSADRGVRMCAWSEPSSSGTLTLAAGSPVCRFGPMPELSPCLR